MLILSQNKISITNFDNSTTIEIKETKDNEYVIKAYLTNTREIYLAVYDTEERAKEVLQEIIKNYKINDLIQSDSVTIRNKVVYEMPEK